MRNKIAAALVTAACALGLGAASASADTAQSRAGAWRDATHQCLAQFPSTCNNLSLQYASCYGSNGLCLVGITNYTFVFYGYYGPNRVYCVFSPMENAAGSYYGQWKTYACYYG